MKISAKIFPHARKNEIEVIDEHTLKVRLTAIPVRGKANMQLLKMLSKKYKIAQSRITIVRGKSSRCKVIEIDNGS